MPIIPSGWTGLQTVNAIGTGGSSNPYKYCKSFKIDINDLTEFIELIGKCENTISRELSISVISGSVDVFWKNYNNELFIINSKPLLIDDILIDNTLGMLGIAIKVLSPCKIFVTIRWDKNLDFYIYTGEELVVSPKIRLLLPTGANYPVNSNLPAYDTGVDTTTYTSNLDKLKNSNSGVTGYKLFDIFSFYPGKPISFAVIINNPIASVYGNIAFQLFDPLDIAQSAMDVAADIINIENNNITDSFVGNFTRNALYKDVSDNQVTLQPDFSRHVGRIVAQNIDNNNYYDTVIIESYTPNTDPLLGGTFTLTGQF